MRKLLVANRGEIAVRIIRTARELGISTVAVYSDVDANAMHVRLADEAAPLGDPIPSASYLAADKIIAAARAHGADAIHPGYGFLSERPSFAEACEDAGLVFVGPPSSAMRALGGKIEAKAIASSNGVPVTPGCFEPGDRGRLHRAADEIGYPVMLKASAGGGGRGMRIVRSPDDFDQEFATASDEALKAFGDGSMMVEKLIERPRHVEVQILADRHGNVAALFERECSLQRRHQKLVEEAPAPGLPAQVWEGMREASIRLARAAGYVGAGTVEFMFDEAAGTFYFLEVNARLQVEHPVTEAIAGIDLVAWQIRIADGEPLRLPEPLMAGDRSAIRGHAIEARIVAEDPARGFLPSAGRIVGWAPPYGHPGVRVDTGLSEGGEVPQHYDSLISKVIAHGEDREAARRRLRDALLDFHVLGVPTNIAYLLEVVGSDGFCEGRFDTGFLAREFGDWRPASAVPEELGALAAAGTSASPEDGQHAPSVWGGPTWRVRERQG